MIIHKEGDLSTELRITLRLDSYAGMGFPSYERDIRIHLDGKDNINIPAMGSLTAAGVVDFANDLLEISKLVQEHQEKIKGLLPNSKEKKLFKKVL